MYLVSFKDNKVRVGVCEREVQSPRGRTMGVFLIRGNREIHGENIVNCVNIN